MSARMKARVFPPPQPELPLLRPEHLLSSPSVSTAQRCQTEQAKSVYARAPRSPEGRYRVVQRGTVVPVQHLPARVPAVVRTLVPVSAPYRSGLRAGDSSANVRLGSELWRRDGRTGVRVGISKCVFYVMLLPVLEINKSAQLSLSIGVICCL